MTRILQVGGMLVKQTKYTPIGAPIIMERISVVCNQCLEEKSGIDHADVHYTFFKSFASHLRYIKRK